MDMSVFMASVRASLFNGKMSAAQVAGLERLLAAWEKYGTGLDNQLAYILATSYHETGRRMTPVREGFASSDEQARKILEKAWSAGKLKWVKTPYWRNGWYGRGDVQLTHESNYSGKIRDAVWHEFGVDIHEDPDQVLEPEISAFVLIEGIMKRATLKADFTAYALEDFVNETASDYRNARKCVNPAEKDSYDKIAAYAVRFETALRAARAEDGTEVADAETDLTDGRYHKALEQIQKQLKGLGYPEVGVADGRWGTKCRGAVLAFQADNGLLTTGMPDDELIVALAHAEPRQLSPTRTTATVADLADAGEAKDAFSIKSFGKMLGFGGLTVGAGQGSFKVSQLTEQFGALKALGDALKDMAPYLVLAAAGFAVYYFGSRIVEKHLKAYREGRM
jgi:hypothetical protein